MKTLCMDTTNKYLVVGLYEDGRLICGTVSYTHLETSIKAFVCRRFRIGWMELMEN